MREQDLRDLIRLVDELGIAELRVERGDTRIHIQRASKGGAPVAGAGEDARPAPVSPAEPGQTILSPAVGRFCRAGAAGELPAVADGQPVAAGQRIGFVETMGIKGEVVSPVAGDAVEFKAEDGQGVEYGQPLAVVYSRPDAD